MTKPASTLSRLQSIARERRRPGRIEYTNLDLIALLRCPAEAGDASSEQGDGREEEHLGYIPALPELVPKHRVRLIVDGRPIDPVEVSGNRRTFIVPSGHHVVRLASPDGAEVCQLGIVTRDRYDVIPADHPALVAGWGACERDARTTWRCVIGVAELPVSHFAGCAKVTVCLKQ